MVVRLRTGCVRQFWFEEIEVQTVANGTVKRVISDRGFGFIGGEDGKEYFFHRNEVAGGLDFDRLVGGENVSFDVENSPKGPRAVKVTAAA